MAEAMELINDYMYRKEFGLSYEQFLDEPFDVYITNLQLINIINKIKSRAGKI